MYKVKCVLIKVEELKRYLNQIRKKEAKIHNVTNKSIMLLWNCIQKNKERGI